MMWDWGNWSWGLMMLLMVPFWGAIVALIVWLVVRSNRHETHAGPRSPLDIAKERYAKGEITSDEYEKLKGDLSK